MSEFVKFEMSDEELDKIITDRIIKRVDSHFDDRVDERARELIGRIIGHQLGEDTTSELRNKNTAIDRLEWYIDKVVREHVEEAVKSRDLLSDERLARIEKDIASGIAWGLREHIVESIGRLLLPSDDDEEQI